MSEGESISDPAIPTGETGGGEANSDSPRFSKRVMFIGGLTSEDLDHQTDALRQLSQEGSVFKQDDTHPVSPDPDIKPAETE